MEYNDWYGSGFAPLGLLIGRYSTECLHLLLELLGFLLHLQTDCWCDKEWSRLLHHSQALLWHVWLLRGDYFPVYHATWGSYRAIYYSFTAIVSYLHGSVLVDIYVWGGPALAIDWTCLLYIQHSIYFPFPLHHSSPGQLKEEPGSVYQAWKSRLYFRYHVHPRHSLLSGLLF